MKGGGGEKNMSIKGSFPTSHCILPSSGLKETFTPCRHDGLVPRMAFCPPASRRGQSGDSLRLSNQFLLAPGQSLVSLSTGNLPNTSSAILSVFGVLWEAQRLRGSPTHWSVASIASNLAEEEDPGSISQNTQGATE